MPAAQVASANRPVETLVSRLASLSDRDPVALADVVEAFGGQSFLPMLIVPALLLVSPLSGIPFFSTICGLTIALTAAQMLWPGRAHLWLPDRLMRQRVSGTRANQAIARLHGVARWLDARARARFQALVIGSPGRPLLELCCLAAGLTIPVFELVPFSSSVLGLAVLLMATGMMARDGLFAVLGLAVLGAAATGSVLALDVVTGGG